MPKQSVSTIRKLGKLAIIGLLVSSGFASPVLADNQMGYRLLTARAAANLPHNRGSLGLDVERAQQITDGGMSFDIMRVKQVRSGSAGGRAGFNTGDMIIAVDGQVFPSIAAFAAYIGSVTPGTAVIIDYIPSGGGPAQAQRLSVTLGGASASSQARNQPSTGMSTREKLAIGAGAVALFGCYEMGCFSKRQTDTPVQGQQNNSVPAR